ncbi:hypothetical protein MAGR_62020 [Mycolicibacterium agri]|uniref:Uncharacterized protein n=1 Tax=Mycolicibacterium agri TaxID=36811 RepID=A0A7I9WAP3_MYCAG|nr:hypothetical protein MAGR_62020 [Mycolicibacterium agri]
MGRHDVLEPSAPQKGDVFYADPGNPGRGATRKTTPMVFCPNFFPNGKSTAIECKLEEPAGAEKLPPVEAARPAHTRSSLRRDSASLRAWCRDRNEFTNPTT